MKRALLIASLCMVSCSPSRVLVQSRQTDSVRIDEKIRIRTQIKYVPVIVHIPDQQTSVIAEPSDTSHLETKYAAYVPTENYITTYGISRKRSPKSSPSRLRTQRRRVRSSGRNKSGSKYPYRCPSHGGSGSGTCREKSHGDCWPE